MAKEYLALKSDVDAINSKLITGRHPNNLLVIKNITDAFYAADSATKGLRAEIARGDFSNVHPGNYIIGKATGTKWWVVEDDYYYGNRTSGWGAAGHAENTHHLAIMPQQLIGVAEQLWSGEHATWNSDKTTTNGVAPWQADADATVGKNDTTGGYYNSYIRNTVLPKVYEKWLKADFENFGIKVLPFWELDSTSIDTTKTSAGFSGWTGASNNWAWYEQNVAKCTLPSIQNLTGGNGFQSSGYDCGVLKEQLAIFKVGMSYQEFIGDVVHVWGDRNTWTKNVASGANACHVHTGGHSYYYGTSCALGVRPLAFVA